MAQTPSNDAHPQADDHLRVDLLPPLPQAQTIRELAPRLWRDERVVALWLGGSFAAGTADQYSDIDLRVAVPPAELARWQSPDLDALLGSPPLARQFLPLSDDTFLHHLIVANGAILDLLIHNAEVAPSAEPILTLGCRDAAFARLLAASDHAPTLTSVPVVADDVRELIVGFWVNSHKHRKVLHRALDLMFPAATYTNWRFLMRLWYIAATGSEVRPQHFTGIHGLTELVRAVERVYGSEPLALCGAPTRNRAEICASIEQAQDVMSRLGRELAERYGFVYPTELEAVTRREWRAFRAGSQRAAL